MTRTRGVTIGAIMWTTFVVCFGLAALRNASETCAGGTFLVTCGVLLCGLIAAVCRPAAERPWWLGFTLFGVGYLWLALEASGDVGGHALPTSRILDALAPPFDVPPPDPPRFQFRAPFAKRDYYLQVGHDLWALIFATVGGSLAFALCTRFGGGTVVPTALVAPLDQTRSKPWRRPAVIACTASVSQVIFALFAYPRAPELAAAVAYLLTCTLIGLAIIGTVLGRGQHRAAWLGAALFGGGYLFVHAAAPPDGARWFVYRPMNSLLAVYRPGLISGLRALHGSAPRENETDALIREKLELKVPMNFPYETPFEEVMKYIKTATQGPHDQGIRFYIDPGGLDEAEHTLQSPVALDVEGVPLKTTLPLLLKQLDLGCFVRDGLLIITRDPDTFRMGDDSYFLIGQCVFAGFAAALGSLLAPLVAAPRRERPASV